MARMGSLLIREWNGFNQFPAPTQHKLVEYMTKLKQEDVSTLTILVLGKGGVGKSSTVNSLLGERAVTVSSFQSEALRPVMVSRTRAGFTLNIIDTPGLVEAGYVSHQSLELIKRFLLNKTIDIMLYVDRLDTYRVDELDRQIVSAITDSFGKQIWYKSLLVLTHAQLSPPDNLDYEVFVSKRSEAILRTVRTGAKFWKRDFEEFSIPVILAENSGRCKQNAQEEKILPNGDVWITNLVKSIIDVATNGKQAIVVDKNLIDGPNANYRGKVFIPLIALGQWVIVKWFIGAIKSDIAKEGNAF
jgi:GTP-binding protein